jgi:dipeptidase E
LKDFLSATSELLFIPYAQPGGISYDQYTSYPRKALKSLGLVVKGIHEYENETAAIEKAEAIFIGGGNTFLLLKTLYEKKLIRPLRQAVQNGTRYMGSSAGSNVAGLSIGTTNDMPIVYPPSFEALAFVPFNINPHYLDPKPDDTHMGETRETRIKEFHVQNSQAVIGLREGSWLRVKNDRYFLGGDLTARLFNPSQEPRELEPGDVSQALSF